MKKTELKSETQAISFLSRYAHVLMIIMRDPSVTIREISIILGVTERTIHIFLNQLEQQGVISIKRQGRKNTYRVLLDAKSPSRFENGCKVRDVLGIISDLDISN